VIDSYRSFQINEERLATQADASIAVSQLIKELRIASEVSVAEPDQIVIYGCLPQSQTCLPPLILPRLEYQLTNGQIIRREIEPTPSPCNNTVDSIRTTQSNYCWEEANAIQKPIILNVQNSTTPLFRYYNSTSQELSSPVELSAVEFLRLHLTIDQDPNELPQALTTDTSIQLRNRRRTF
jgi:hypothetical protein